MVQQLAARALGAHGPMRLQAAQQPLDDLDRAGAERRVLGVLGGLAQGIGEAGASASRAAQRQGDVRRGQPEDLAGGQVVQADRVLRVVQGAQEADQHPHLGLPVQARRPAEAPRDARHVQGSQVRVGIAIAADQDGVVAGMPPGADGGTDPVRDRIGLVRPGRVAEQLDRASLRLGAAELGPSLQPLVESLPGFQPIRVVVADQPMRRVEDSLPAAVVVDQHDARRGRIRLTEAEDVAEGRAAEAVDALVVVADDRHVAVLGGQQLHDLPLRVVRVLELVDQDVPIPRALLVEDGRMLAQEAQREAHLVPEVDPVGRPHQLLVGGVRRRELGLGCGALGQRLVVGTRRRRIGQSASRGLVGLRRDVLVPQPADQRHQAREEARRVAQRAVSVERQLEQVLSQQDDLLRPAQHRGAIGQPGLEGVLPQQPVAERVERADPRVVVAVRDQPVDALEHLECGAIGERQRQDLGRLGPLLGDQPGDPAGDDRRLAGSRSGDDEERSVAMGHGLALARGQVGEQRGLDAQVRPTGTDRRDELLEEWELVWRRHDRWHLVRDGSRWGVHPVVISRLIGQLSCHVGSWPWGCDQSADPSLDHRMRHAFTHR